jgi:hypothetical protein
MNSERAMRARRRLGVFDETTVQEVRARVAAATRVVPVVVA